MSVNLDKTLPQSGYTLCACRDCMDITVSSKWPAPLALCSECEGAGCLNYSTRANLDYEGGREFECQREDAYDQECTCDHLRAQYDPTYRQCRFCQSLSA